MQVPDQSVVGSLLLFDFGLFGRRSFGSSINLPIWTWPLCHCQLYKSKECHEGDWSEVWLQMSIYLEHEAFQPFRERGWLPVVTAVATQLVTLEFPLIAPRLAPLPRRVAIGSFCWVAKAKTLQ
jgi:hypothetical protein